MSCAEDGVSEPINEDPGFETPSEIVPKITRGINIGNTLEAPYEGEWYPNPLREYYFDDIKDAGFTCVRIPVRWDKHTSQTDPYEMDERWLARVEQVIDWGLSRDLYLIINAHHEGWLKENYSEPGVKERFHFIWRKVSERFRNKSGKLMFEIINEPEGLTVGEVDEINRDVLAIIRETNPKRVVIIGGNSWSNAEHLFTAAVPEDDYLMAYYHSYDPWQFAGEGVGKWGGSFSQLEDVRKKFAQVKLWSEQNNIPVMISEFGAITDCDYNSRMLHYYVYTEYATRYNIPFMVWDDGGDFIVYDRENRTWSDVKDVLVNTYHDGPRGLKAFVSSAMMDLVWTNRSETSGSLLIQQKDESGNFITFLTVGTDISQINFKYEGTGSLFYRVVLRTDNHPDRYSNPVKVVVP